jgi:hypothetical protein
MQICLLTHAGGRNAGVAQAARNPMSDVIEICNANHQFIKLHEII